MATYQNLYAIKAAGAPNADRDAPLTGFTLYEAAKNLSEIAAAGNVNDATHISCDGRCVAFWSAWTNEVTAMFGATDDERKMVTTWSF